MFKKWGVIIIPGIAGLVILLYGIWEVVRPREPIVEIVRSDRAAQCDSGSCGEIVVDVEGAVQKPGIYKLTTRSRIGDALVAAGGLEANADREWVARMLNLAEEVKDGKKIYIPRQSDLPADRQETQNTSKSDISVNQNGKININTASQSELESLTGIGEARAKAIMTGRPYADASEIVSKAKIPTSVYEQIKDQLSVY